MPLDDREQRILEEIEAQFYEEDPRFAQTVRDTTLRHFTGRKIRWAAFAAFVGLVVMLVFFTFNTFVALSGFIVMVASAGWMVTALRRRRGGDGPGMAGWMEGLRRRWRRNR